MSKEIGDGLGIDWPASQDTDNTKEVDSPNPGATVASSKALNDVIALALAISLELGTDPAGTLADVKTWLQLEHNTNGTHKPLSDNLTWQTDNAKDIGATGANRPRDIFIAGSLKEGTVPLARMQRTEGSAQNAGSVTVTAAKTQIVTLSLGTVNLGDRIFIGFMTLITKGATAGYTRMIIDKSAGTATYQLYNDRTSDASVDLRQEISSSNWMNMFVPMKITATGTLTLQVSGQSFGSDSTVVVGGTEIYALALNNG